MAGETGNAESLRSLVDEYTERRSYATALFYAELLLCSSKSPEDIYRKAHCFFLNEEYKRAYHFLKTQKTWTQHAPSLHLAASALLATSEWDECLELLQCPPCPDSAMRAALGVLCGKAHMGLEQRQQAKTQFIEALAADPQCIEAYQLLKSYGMLSVEEHTSLVHSLKFSSENHLVQQILAADIAKYEQPVAQAQARITAVEDTYAIRQSAVIRKARAETFYHQHDFRACYELTRQLMREDPYDYGPVFLLHVASMVELRLKNELFLCAHQLAEEKRGTALSHYTIGAYYHLLQENDKAREHFSKATLLDGSFVPAWIGYGHSFALQDEHDQAMAAYRAGFRITSSNHLPALYIGMELVRVHNFAQAEQFLQQAMKMNDCDPLIWNELGVIALRNKEFSIAVKHFQKALSFLECSQSEVWEATYSNLGHAYRKQGLYVEAQTAYQQALNLAPTYDSQVRGSLLSCLGFTAHLRGRTDEAIAYYQQALGVDPNHRFTLDMLSRAISSFCG